MIEGLITAIILMLIVRYVPQLAIDLNNRDRRILFSEKTSIKALYIFIAYTVIIVVCAASSIPARLDITNVAGFTFFSLGNLLGILGLWALGKNYSEEILVFEEAALVSHGIYSVIRHPMRCGVALETLGLVLYFNQWILLVVWLFIVVCQVIRTKVEDSFLRHTYGEDASRYQRNVPSINPLVYLVRNQTY